MILDFMYRSSIGWMMLSFERLASFGDGNSWMGERKAASSNSQSHWMRHGHLYTILWARINQGFESGLEADLVQNRI
jgi:hypothetical protein